VSGGADLVRQQLHSKVFSFGQQIRPVRGILRPSRLRRSTALRLQPKAFTMTSTACTPTSEYACRTMAAVGSRGTAPLHAAALASRMRSDHVDQTRETGAHVHQVRLWLG
jgi:hypothetical protein